MSATDKPVPLPRTRPRPAPWLGDIVFRTLCQGAAAMILVVAALLVAVLLWKSMLALRTVGVSFFIDTEWDPEPTHRVFGALAFIWGTVATSAVAMAIAVPLGVGTAIFLAEIAPRQLRGIGSSLVEMLAAVPSVVYGFWGLFFLAPIMQRSFTALGGPNQGGVGILTAGVVLSIMIVPYVASVSFDVIRSVPRSQREGALALGATRWQTIWNVVIPYARPGIVGGAFLALGRALGETMAVTMLIGNKGIISLSPFALGNTIPSVIANEFTEATYDLYLSALVLLGLLLFGVSALVNASARFLIWRAGKPASRWSLFDWFTGGKRPGRPVGGVVEERIPLPPTGTSWSPLIDKAMTAVLACCLAITAGSLFLIIGFLAWNGLGSINLEFFTALPKRVGAVGGGMANALYGSFLMVGLATLLSVPVGLFAAVYLAEFRSGWFGAAVRFVSELLGGVPSIVVGIFAYNLFVVPMGGFSAWAGAFALAVMMLPVVVRAAEEALRLVPRTLREASFALGANHWQTVLRVTIPAALPAIITAVFLAIARVAGETAPLIMTAFSNNYWPRSLNDPTPSLPYYIFQYAISPYPDWHRQAWAAAFVLVAFVMLMNFGVRFLAGKRMLAASRAD